MDQQNVEPHSIVTLRLKDHDIPVDKEKLVQVSKYFAALFSHKFKDSTEKVHVINYEINLITLKAFADWIHNGEDEETACIAKPPFAAVLPEDFAELLELLKLSVLYIVDQLTDDIIGIIAQKWLQPERTISIWLLAQELSLNVLRDLCLATCLDRFEELPKTDLIHLSKENILQLVGSKCIRASHSSVKRISKKWSQYHAEPLTICQDHTELPTFLRCTVGYSINKKAYVYCWDGTKLSELVQLKDCEKGCVKKDIVGMQATGRGFSVYVIGGERGLGTGKFNMEIWRYCLISRRWYYQDRLPVARRHMVAVFLDNKLVVVGGVGRLRLKLSSVDVLDIHQGCWKKAAEVREEFTEIPAHCVMKGKLFLLRTFIHIYDPEKDSWHTVNLYSDPSALRADAFTEFGKTLFFTYSDDRTNEKTMLFRVDSTTCNVNECSTPLDDPKTTEGGFVVRVDHEWYKLTVSFLTGINILFMGIHDEKWTAPNVNVHGTEVDNLNVNFINPKLGCFDLINPNILNGQVLKND